MSSARAFLLSGLAVGLMAVVACAPAQPAPTQPPAKPAAPAAKPAEKAAAPAASPAAKPAEKPAAPPAEWERVLAAAKQEGKVVILGPAIAGVRRVIEEGFQEKYGIRVEYTAGPTAELDTRITSERGAGLYTIDFLIHGLTSYVDVHLPKGNLDPARPYLMLPEVVDPKNWQDNKILFNDPGDHILRTFTYVSQQTTSNTNLVNLNQELKTWKELLDPKWKGKFATDDPSIAGAGRGLAIHLSVKFGEEVVRDLFVKQEPVLLRDRRQLIELVARGTYGLGLATDPFEVERLRLEGLPLAHVQWQDDLGYVTSGSWNIARLKNAPNPNAATVFLNWWASKHGQETVGKALGFFSRRTDVSNDWVIDSMRPKPGVDYVDQYEYKFATETRKPAGDRVGEIMKERVGG